MNVPRYEFCTENKHLLLDFIKKANQCKSNPYCNISEYNRLSKILPLGNILDQCSEENEVIDIIDSDEDQISETEIDNTIAQTLQESGVPLNETARDDIICGIREILETKKCLSLVVISDLHKPNLDLDRIFKQLFDHLSFEEIVDFGTSLISNVISDEKIILAYVKHMLIQQLALEYSDQFQNILNDIYSNYPEILTQELTKYLLNYTDVYPRVTLQYIDGLFEEFKLKLLRHFVSNCKNLQENHLAVFDVLVESQVENEAVNKLVELLSISAESFATNKVFGKFLLKIVELTGNNISSLEKPMRHIIGSHRSIWKTKIQKTFETLIQDNMLSQSLRY